MIDIELLQGTALFAEVSADALARVVATAVSRSLRRGDVVVAKNYLTAEELEVLNRIVTAYLEFAELQASSRRPMHMADWITKLDDFLRLSEQSILAHAGRVSHQQAEHHVHQCRGIPVQPGTPG